MKKTIEKINESKSCFIQNINKIDKLLARFIKEKRETIQINKVRIKKGEFTVSTTDMQRIIKNYYKQLYANKMNSLEEMDKFLGRNNLPRLTLYSWRRSRLSAFNLSKSSLLSINVVKVNSKVQSWTWTSTSNR